MLVVRRPVAMAVLAVSAAGAASIGGATPASAAQVTVPITACTSAPGCFPPGTTTVNQGDDVIWSNGTLLAHTATADGGAFATGTIAPGAKSAPQHPAPGTYTYHCAIHPSMTGTLKVNATATQPPPTQPPPTTAAATPPPATPPAVTPLRSAAPGATPPTGRSSTSGGMTSGSTTTATTSGGSGAGAAVAKAASTATGASPSSPPGSSGAGVVGRPATSAPAGSRTGLVVAAIVLVLGLATGGLLLLGRLRRGPGPGP